MSKSNDQKTREFEHRMRTVGAAGFAAGPWKDIEESLGMDQSVVVDQEGNPVWSVKHTRKPQRTGRRGGFDRLMGGVAMLAFAALVTSILAISFTDSPGPGLSDSRLASTGQASDTEPDQMIASLQAPAAGYIDRPAIEVYQGTQDEPEPTMADTGTDPAITEPDTTIDSSMPATAASDVPQSAENTDEQTTLVEDTVSINAIDEVIETAPEPVASEATETVTTETDSVAEAAVANEITVAETTTDTIIIDETPPTSDSPAAATADPVVDAPAVTEAVTETDAPAPAVAETIETAPEPDATEVAETVATEMDSVAEAPVANEMTVAETTADTIITDETPPASDSLVVATADPVVDAPAVTEADTETDTPAPATAGDATTLAMLEPETPAPAPVTTAAENLEANAADTGANIPQPGDSGRWIINLASYAGPKTANRMQQKFEARGVTTKQQVAEVNGKTMYRLRIANFESRRDAQAYFDSIKEKLGLESTWITKQ